MSVAGYGSDSNDGALVMPPSRWENDIKSKMLTVTDCELSNSKLISRCDLAIGRREEESGQKNQIRLKTMA
jgi:hypothetical protein